MCRLIPYCSQVPAQSQSVRTMQLGLWRLTVTQQVSGAAHSPQQLAAPKQLQRHKTVARHIQRTRRLSACWENQRLTQTKQTESPSDTPRTYPRFARHKAHVTRHSKEIQHAHMYAGQGKLQHSKTRRAPPGMGNASNRVPAGAPSSSAGSRQQSKTQTVQHAK